MNQSKLKLIGNIFYGLIIFLLILVAGTAAISAFNIPGGIKLFTVQSGSMETAIKTGSVVVVKPQTDYRTGDIITFMSEQDRGNTNPKNTVTHRIYDVKNEEGIQKFITKGDANDSPDGFSPTPDLVLGKSSLAIPFLGYAVSFARTQAGLIFLIIIPATLIVYSELMNVKNEAKRLLIERKNRKLNVAEKIEVLVGQEEIAFEEGIKSILKKNEKKTK